MTYPRNAPCHCGSGKKYKRCHLLLEWRATGQAWSPLRSGSFYAGTLNGKPIHVTRDSGTTTVSDLRRHLARFNLATVLREIGEISARLETKDLDHIDGVTIMPNAPAYIARVAIEAGSDDVETSPSSEDLAEAFRIFNCLEEAGMRERTESWALEHLIRMGHAQFSGRSDLRTALARAWILFHDLWPQVAKARAFDIASAIQREIGLELRHLMALGFAYSGRRSMRGHFVPYDSEALAKFPASLGLGIEHNERFLAWISATYDNVRRRSATLLLGPGYDKYTLSPLLATPVIRPDTPPRGAPPNVLLVPVPRFVALRVTDGIFHALATAYEGPRRRNPFRTAFGHVFEAYVGHILRAGSGNVRVEGERSYGPGEKRCSPDWLILDATRLVVLEAKASGLTLNTKMLGDLDAVQVDLKKQIAEGIQQLLNFRADLRGQVAGLEDFRHVTEVELVLVVHGEMPWANWLLRDTIAKDLPGAADVHICTIAELEDLQRHCWGRSPFDLLASKRSGAADAVQYDFAEWLSAMPSVAPHPVLAAAASELFSSWGATFG